LNLHCKLPFGQLHKGNPIIIEAAAKMGRTPNSLAMKLCNFASLDPVQQARGVRGLPGATKQDRAMWREFHDDYGASSRSRFWSRISFLLPASKFDCRTSLRSLTQCFSATTAKKCLSAELAQQQGNTGGRSRRQWTIGYKLLAGLGVFGRSGLGRAGGPKSGVEHRTSNIE
jgi:hypothetical protein